MPLVFERPLDILKMQQPPDLHTLYGHHKRQATRCGHLMHPTAPYRTPLCPSCITGRANGTLDAALGALIAVGGPEPLEDERNQQWRRAKLRYDIAKQRQTRDRIRNQLRDEREQAWEQAHQPFDSQWSQEIISSHDFVGCPACASMTQFPTKFVRIEPPRHVTWWEQPGRCAIAPQLVLTVPRPSGRGQRRPQKAKGSPFIRGLIQESRQYMAARENGTTSRTELVVRRKFNLDIDFAIPVDFWDSPIPESSCRKIYRQMKENERMHSRHLRGNALRPVPPRSSLSYSELSEDIEIDQPELEQMWRTEKAEILERQAWKVGEQVGYLYFVGDYFDGLFDWRDDFLRSDRQLIYRKGTSTDTVMSEASTSSEEDDSSDEEDDKEDD